MPELLRLLALCLLVALSMAGGRAQAQAQQAAEQDPPGRVGRLSDLAGAVSVFDIETAAWAGALRNRPLTTGDRVTTGPSAMAVMRIGSITLRLDAESELEFLRLDDERVRVLLHRGSLALQLRSAEVAAEVEIGSDVAWLAPVRDGLFRLDVLPSGTFASSWRGPLQVLEAPGDRVEAGQRVVLWREGPGQVLQRRTVAMLDDGFAARAMREALADEQAPVVAQVSQEMTGIEDLGRHGRWVQHPEHGTVWVPDAVSGDWAPYRQGRWTWVRPWGWTWVDDAPWGFAPFHYGRWVHWRGRWTWVPGRYEARPTYAPALVAWIDGPGAGVGLRWGGSVWSWLPLAPWEAYQPHYRVSPGYRDRVNPPDPRRGRPPPRGSRERPGNHDVPGAITVRPPEMVRPTTPLPSREQILPRPGREARPVPPPLPPVSITPPPSRRQPVPPQPLPGGTPPAPKAPPKPSTPHSTPTTTPPPPRPVEAARPAMRPPPPPAATTPLPSRPQPAVPPEPRRAEPRPAAPVPPPARERERELPREDQKPQPREGRGQAR